MAPILCYLILKQTPARKIEPVVSKLPLISLWKTVVEAHPDHNKGAHCHSMATPKIALVLSSTTQPYLLR